MSKILFWIVIAILTFNCIASNAITLFNWKHDTNPDHQRKVPNCKETKVSFRGIVDTEEYYGTMKQCKQVCEDQGDCNMVSRVAAGSESDTGYCYVYVCPIDWMKNPSKIDWKTKDDKVLKKCDRLTCTTYMLDRSSSSLSSKWEHDAREGKRPDCPKAVVWNEGSKVSSLEKQVDACKSACEGSRRCNVVWSFVDGGNDYCFLYGCRDPNNIKWVDERNKHATTYKLMDRKVPKRGAWFRKLGRKFRNRKIGR